MNIKINSSEEFEKLLEALASEIVEANIHFQLYQDLKLQINDYVTEYNQSQAFWSLTFQSHLDVAIYRLCKIYDQHNTSLNLRNLLDTIQENLHLFDIENFRDRLKDNPYVESLSSTSRKPDEKQLHDDLSYVSESNPIVKKLVIWRGNFYAHKAVKKIIKGQKLSEEYPMKLEEIEELLIHAKEIINRYCYLFRASGYSTQIIGHDDHKYILESIRSNMKRTEKELEEEYKRIRETSS